MVTLSKKISCSFFHFQTINPSKNILQVGLAFFFFFIFSEIKLLVILISSAIISCIKRSCPSCHFYILAITFVYLLNYGILSFSLEHVGSAGGTGSFGSALESFKCELAVSLCCQVCRGTQKVCFHFLPWVNSQGICAFLLAKKDWFRLCLTV